jgi:hypothetical protein
MIAPEETKIAHTPDMADADKLQSLQAELEDHKRKLEEMQQRYGSPEAQVHPEAAREHMHSMRELIASTENTLRTLIELLGRAGI